MGIVSWGGFIGEVEDAHAFVSEKVKTWTSGVGVLAEAAELYLQAAFVALSNLSNFNGLTSKQWYQIVNPALKSCTMH